MQDWHNANDECSKQYMISLINYQKRSLKTLEEEINKVEMDISTHKEQKAVENNYKILKDKIKVVDDKISSTKSTKFKRDQDDYQKGNQRNWPRSKNDQRQSENHPIQNYRTSRFSSFRPKKSFGRRFSNSNSNFHSNTYTDNSSKTSYASKLYPHNSNYTRSNKSPNHPRYFKGNQEVFLDKEQDQRLDQTQYSVHTQNRFQMLKSPIKKRPHLEMEEEDIPLHLSYRQN
ncbi:Hypothetical predicted protein [Pelobates cultripes]|uniref:Uncharacterized protein n=1 Tax=Pelobates cultripes TaxID=61616 RepID=A0AAD1VKB6_PELCU|nr:Hypothetical predicted protein [Pelobates cultripes]